MKKQLIIIFLFFIATSIFAQTEKSKPFVLGVIEEIQSVQLGEKRILNIYLPAGYHQNDTTAYPVIYLLDGSADEDFIHVAGLVQFYSFPWIKRLPGAILVGIANVDRKRDFTFPTTIEEDKTRFPTTGHSDKFIAFIELELIPFIENKYKTNQSKTIIGQSLGGLLATEILLNKPQLFNKYIIISPSLWWDNGSLLNKPSSIFRDDFSQQADIYIGVGKEGVTPTKIPRIMEEDAKLLSEKLKKIKSKNVQVFFDYLPAEDHATIGHQAIFNAIQLLYPSNQKH